MVSPSSDSLREIIEYTSTGTDGNGDYIVVSARGVGGTTEQTHTVGEKVRMNITAEDWEDMRDDIDSIVAAGALNASITQKGLVEIATDAEVIAGTDTGETGANLVATPGQIKTNYSSPINVQTFLISGTWTKPTGTPKIVFIQAWGGGGSGGSNSSYGSGGGGGSYKEVWLPISSLGSTETITIGAGGIAKTNDIGEVGGNTTVGSLLTAYGGGAGGIASAGSGGGGGGYTSAGGNGSTTGGNGGSPFGGAGGNSTAGGTSIFGGGGGGEAAAGGESIYGGGGGGGLNIGGNSYYGGGGGGGGGSSAIAGGTSVYGGNGGSGGDNSPLPTAGSVPGGGGGGSKDNATPSGAGGNGKCIITTFF